MLTVQALAHAINAEFIGEDVPFRGAHIDSRLIEPGQLFVAIKTNKADGHDYISQAIDNGAAVVLVTRAQADLSIPQIIVADVIRSLGQVAKVWREQFRIPIIAITGSCGKTTTKEMLASILSECGHVCYTQGNYNNHLGTPLTLLRITDQHQFAVVEVGTNHPGEVPYLTKIVEPTISVITNIRAAHVGNFEGVDAIADEKSFVYQDLIPSGIAVINEDEPYAKTWHQLANRRHTVTFSLDDKADVTVAHSHTGVQGLSADLNTPLGRQAVAVPLLGPHAIHNVLPAVACAMAAGASLSQVALGLSRVSPVPGRMCLRDLGNHHVLIDDSYNNIPTAVTSSVDFLVHCPGERILVLTHMAELGGQAEEEHRRIGHELTEAGLDSIILVGDTALLGYVQEECKQAVIYGDKVGVETYLKNKLADDGGVSILIKGARSMQMETVVQGLVDGCAT